MELANLAEDSKTKITWKHVAAHSGIPGNEVADKLAMNAAKQLTVHDQGSRDCYTNSSSSTISSNVEKPACTVSNTRPRVIVIQKKDYPIDSNITIQSDTKHHMTPNRKATRNRSETPVPGSMNGSFATIQQISANSQKENEKTK